MTPLFYSDSIIEYSTGAIGDTKGTMAYAKSGGLYLCTANYDGSTEIWKPVSSYAALLPNPTTLPTQVTARLTESAWGTNSLISYILSWNCQNCTTLTINGSNVSVKPADAKTVAADNTSYTFIVVGPKGTQTVTVTATSKIKPLYKGSQSKGRESGGK